jgi:tetratricopeptide (TPR) repeat protein
VDWDDPLNYLENPHYRGLGSDNIAWAFSTFNMGHYQPLTWLTLGADATIARAMYDNELDPRPYHFTNNLLHAINAVLVFLIALRLFRPSIISRQTAFAALIGSFAAALFFGVHPLRVESVAWATERRDLLSGFFLLLSVLAYLRAQVSRQTSRAWFIASLVLFVMSLLSKVIGVTLPVVLLLLDWYPLRRLDASSRNWLKQPSRGALLEKIPYFALSLGFSMLASIGQGANNWLMTLDAHPLPARIMQSFYGLVFYAQKTLVPTNLLPLYQMPIPLPYTELKYVASAGIVIAAAITVIVLHRRLPWLFVTAAAYAIMLAPVLGLVQNGSQIVADRYSYLPCIPWAILAGAGVMLAMRGSSAAVRSIVLVFALAAVIALSLLTARQATVWRTTESLWTHTYHGDPDGLFARNGYGFALLERGEYAQAIPLFRGVLQDTPANDKAWINLWNALDKIGDDSGLEQALRDGAIAMDQVGNLRVALDARYRLGNLLMNVGRNDEAVLAYQAVTNQNPKNAPAFTNLGLALQKLNRPQDAEAAYLAAIAADPNLYQAHLNFASLLRSQNRIPQAIEQYREVLRIKPDHAGAAEARNRLTASPR